jgi:hypothetical protein
MDMYSRNQYLEVLREEYLKVNKKQKMKLLDEAQKRTGLKRKYLIRKLRVRTILGKKIRKKRKETYDSYVKTALFNIWEIFDYPCGQRLAPILKTETERLEELGELEITSSIIEKLKKISPATIARKLKHKKVELYHIRKKGIARPGSLLYQKIPVRLNDWDTSIIGNLAIDFVEHCGSSKQGLYINTLSAVEISSGWWEGEAIMGRGQYPTQEALDRIRKRTPFLWLEIHPDNDSAFINAHLFDYCRKKKIRFTRSRPNKKNDNCYVEQKNWTHIKKVFGYLRYDTEEELNIINSLYENELRLYKNFFSPVMKLKEKIRVGGKLHRKYDTPKTPYQRLFESNQIKEDVKEELKDIYLSLNPAQLKREIENKTDKLYKIYKEKMKEKEVKPYKKQKPIMVTNYMIYQNGFRLPA